MNASGNWISQNLANDLVSGGTNAFRIASGPGFWIERYGETAIISWKPGVDAHSLATSISEHGWNPQRVFARQLVRNPGESDNPVLLLGDSSLSPLEIVNESGLLFELDFSASYSPGLFPDQRLNRILLRDRKPRRVLNTFAYTCAFSVAAAKAGAETLSVDISKSSLQRGRRNFELNRISGEGHRFVPEDVPTYLRRLMKRGEQFDAIILDPPTFGRSTGGKTFRFERDFPCLLEYALHLALPGAAILLSTNIATWDAATLIQRARDVLPPQTEFQTLPSPPDFSGHCPSATVWALI